MDLFSSPLYQENHLAKPDVLDMIDYLNDTMGYGLDYHIFDEKELIESVVKCHE